MNDRHSSQNYFDYKAILKVWWCGHSDVRSSLWRLVRFLCFWPSHVLNLRKCVPPHWHFIFALIIAQFHKPSSIFFKKFTLPDNYYMSINTCNSEVYLLWIWGMYFCMLTLFRTSLLLPDRAFGSRGNFFWILIKIFFLQYSKFLSCNDEWSVWLYTSWPMWYQTPAWWAIPFRHQFELF